MAFLGGTIFQLTARTVVEAEKVYFPCWEKIRILAKVEIAEDENDEQHMHSSCAKSGAMPGLHSGSQIPQRGVLQLNQKPRVRTVAYRH